MILIHMESVNVARGVFRPYPITASSTATSSHGTMRALLGLPDRPLYHARHICT
jgi:hypothetical protein